MDEFFDVDLLEDTKLFDEIDEAGLNVHVDLEEVVNGSENQFVQHDCMLSGCCQSEEHKRRFGLRSVDAILKDYEASLNESSEIGRLVKFYHTILIVLVIESEEDDLMTATVLESNFPTLFPSKPQLYKTLIEPLMPPPTQKLLKTKISPKKPVIITPYPSLPPPPSFSMPPPIAMPASLQIRQIPNPIIKQEEQLQQQKYTIINIQPTSTTSVTFPFGGLPKIEPTVNFANTDPLFRQIIHQHMQVQQFQQKFIKQEETFPLQIIPTVQNVIPETAKPKKNQKRAKRYKTSFSSDMGMAHKQRKYVRRSPQIFYSDNLEDMSIEKRCMHNDMERKRRIDMKNLFVELKRAIPTIHFDDRVAKVNILRAAISYCNQIKSEEKILSDLRRKNKRLMTKMNKLGASIISQANSLGSISSSVTSSASSSFLSSEEY
jgi:hypothetical protein